MEIRLGPEIEKRVLENQRLVHHLLKTKAINPSDYDEILQIGMIGLMKAAMTFDETKNIKFATYAAKCINNEINMYFRGNNKYSNDVSLSEIISEDDSGNVLEIENTVFDESTSNFTDMIQYRESIEWAMRIILNYFTMREKIILLLSIGDVKQRIIAEQFGISQSYASRIEKRLHKRLKEYIKNNKKAWDNPFSVTMEERWLKIAFSTKDIEELSQALESFAADVEEIESFKVKLTNSKVEMYFLADTTSFVLIAKILQEMEEAGVRIDD